MELIITETHTATAPTARPVPRQLADLYGKLVCVTGRCSYGTRADVHRLLGILGARVTDRVSGAVDVLLVGALGSTSWIQGDRGRKHNDAARYGVPVVAERTIL
jgi:NAD-dependent DNA ligase